jgi:hypothetical protein
VMKRERQIYNALTHHMPRLDEKNRAQLARGQRACAAPAQGRSDAAATHCEPKTGGAELFFAVSTATPAIRHAKVMKAIAIR